MHARQVTMIQPAANQTSTTSATIAMWHFDEMAAEIRMLKAELKDARAGRGGLVWTIGLLLATGCGAMLGYLGAVLQACQP